MLRTRHWRAKTFQEQSGAPILKHVSLVGARALCCRADFITVGMERACVAYWPGRSGRPLFAGLTVNLPGLLTPCARG